MYIYLPEHWLPCSVGDCMLLVFTPKHNIDAIMMFWCGMPEESELNTITVKCVSIRLWKIIELFWNRSIERPADPLMHMACYCLCFLRLSLRRFHLISPRRPIYTSPLWRNDMEILSALPALYEGNIPSWKSWRWFKTPWPSSRDITHALPNYSQWLSKITDNESSFGMSDVVLFWKKSFFIQLTRWGTEARAQRTPMGQFELWA